jgi:hypothetical protein
MERERKQTFKDSNEQEDIRKMTKKVVYVFII